MINKIKLRELVRNDNINEIIKLYKETVVPVKKNKGQCTEGFKLAVKEFKKVAYSLYKSSQRKIFYNECDIYTLTLFVEQSKDFIKITDIIDKLEKKKGELLLRNLCRRSRLDVIKAKHIAKVYLIKGTNFDMVAKLNVNLNEFDEDSKSKLIL